MLRARTRRLGALIITCLGGGLLVENPFFKWLERRTVRRWGMSAAY